MPPRRQTQGQKDRFLDAPTSPDQVLSLVDLANMEVGSNRVQQEQFVGLMMQVLQRSTGVPRAYLLPAPLINDHQEPTFRPEIAPRSKVSNHCSRIPCYNDKADMLDCQL